MNISMYVKTTLVFQAGIANDGVWCLSQTENI